MKKNLLLTLSLLLISCISFAGKFVMIPVTETNDLVTLFNNTELKIHYYCDDYVLATTENLNHNGTVIIDNHAFANTDFYAIVYCADDDKNEYVARNAENGKALFSGKNFLIMELLSNDFLPAKNDGMVIVRNIQARLPKATTYPVITEQDVNVLDYLSQVSTDTLMSYIQTLQDFETRMCIHPNAVLAQNWLKQKYESFGLDTVYLQNFHFYGSWDLSSANVIAIQYGTEFPDEYVVCGAHYDSFTFQSNQNGSYDDAPGADDNASGTAGILEAARILSQYDFKRSVIYCSFSGEEYGLYGSRHYAEQCASQGMNIVGYFNLDMIGYLTPGKPIHIDLIYPSPAKSLADYYLNVCDVYFPEVPIRSYSSLPWGNSDHTSFNTVGYKGVWPFEDVNENSPHIHNVPHYSNGFEYLGDIIGPSVNNPDQVNIFAKTNVASVATLAMYDQEMPPPPLAPPTNCVAQKQGNRFIQISWEIPVESTPKQYFVYRDGIKIAETNKSPYTNTLSINDYNLYCYKVTADYWGRESEFSNESCASIHNSIIEYNQKVIIYPNPANDKIYIESQLINHYVEIFDMNGKLMMNKIIDSDVSASDISNLTTGIYIIKIANEVVGKFVKE